jgi:CRISPR-associated protein Cas4
LEALKKDAKDRFGFIYNKLGGNFEAIWNRAQYVLKKRFARLTLISDLPKREFEISIFSKHLGLSGRLDILENGAIPVEIKTGRSPSHSLSSQNNNAGYYLSHAVQLTLYALLIEDKYSIDVDTGYIYYSSADERHVIKIDYYLRREAILQRNKAFQTFLNGKEPEGKCKKCKASAQNPIVALWDGRQVNNNNNNNNIINKNRIQQQMSSFTKSLMAGTTKNLLGPVWCHTCL